VMRLARPMASSAYGDYLRRLVEQGS